MYLQDCPFYVHVSMYVSYESLRVIYHCEPKRKKEQLTTVSAQVIVVTQAGVHCLICTHDARGCAVPEGEQK